MAPMSDSPRVIVFDVNETLSDLTPLADRFAAHGADPRLAQTWFASVLRDGFALTALGDSRPFADIAAALLRSMLPGELPGRANGPAHGPGDGLADGQLDEIVADILSGFRSLPVHPDVREGVRALADSGRTLVTLSNGSSDVAEALLGNAGLREHFEALLSVEDSGIWKPAAAAYWQAVDRCHCRPDEAMLVAVHPWDIEGAQRAGLRTGWLNRTGTPYPSHFARADIEASSLVQLAAQLG